MRRLALIFILIHELCAQPLVNIETVPIGDAGNDPLFLSGQWPYASVPYNFKIGKYEVTVGQYTEFLNSVAASDPYNLYHLSMGSVESRPCLNCVPDPPANIINRFGVDGNYTYSVIGNPNLPVVYVGSNDIRRFANWLHNGATVNSDTEKGAYMMSTGGWYRSPQAKWWIPTDHEWAKAAYYKAGGINSGYWLYPTQSNTSPSASTISTSANNTANYNSSSSIAVGSFSGSPSAYGTFDQGGNVHEYTQDSVLGGGFDSSASRLLPTARPSRTPQENKSIGFRVAQIADNFQNRLQVVNSSQQSNGFALSWYPQGVIVKIQRRTSLMEGTWEQLSNYGSYYSMGMFIDTSAPPDQAFYRIIIE